MPWGDQWDASVMLFRKMHAGTLRLPDFFGFHNEHRIVFPQLLTFAVAQLTHWNVRAELLVIWLLACVCSLNVWRLAQVTGLLKEKSGYWLLLASNALIFTPLQWENLLWGFQIGFFLPLACLTACPWVALSVRAPFNILLTAILCFVTTFSIASGFGSWLMTAPLILWAGPRLQRRGRHLVALGLWFGVAGISVWLYFQSFVRPRGHPSPLEALKHPFRALQFWLAYLGFPFATGASLDWASVATFVGAVLSCLLVGCLFYLWRWRADQVLFRRALPWLALISIALVNCTLTTVGRVGFGMPGALQSRYVSFAVFLLIGLLFLGALLLSHWREDSHALPAPLKHGLVVLGSGLAVLLVLGTIQSLQMWSRFQHERLAGKAVLSVINILDEPAALARYIHWARSGLRPWANQLDDLGYLQPRLLRSNRVREIAGETGGRIVGGLDGVGKTPDGQRIASGWAMLLDRETADSVLLTYDDLSGEPIIFARADVSSPRPDIGRKLGDKYLFSGWMTSWGEGAVPSGAQTIRAWAFDAEVGRAFPIGSASL